MKKNITVSGILLLTMMTFMSCERADLTYKGKTVVEFAPRSTSSTYTSSFSATIKQAVYVSSQDTLELTVNLVGPQQNKDIKVEYTLVTEKLNNFPASSYFIDPTTAIEGMHYNFVPARTGSENGTITIPANSSFGKVKLNTLNSQAAPDVSKRVVIKLLPTSEVDINPNYQYFIVVITRL